MLDLSENGSGKPLDLCHRVLDVVDPRTVVPASRVEVLPNPDLLVRVLRLVASPTMPNPMIPTEEKFRRLRVRNDVAPLDSRKRHTEHSKHRPGGGGEGIAASLAGPKVGGCSRRHALRLLAQGLACAWDVMRSPSSTRHRPVDPVLGYYERYHESLPAVLLRSRSGFGAIGAPGFEPGTSPTRTVRATRLRHAPMRGGF